MNNAHGVGVKVVSPVRADATPSRAATLAAVALLGFCTFLTLYAPQPLLPLFRRIFTASELAVSYTVFAAVLAVALAAPLVGLVADAVGRKRVIITAMFAMTLPTLLAATAPSLPWLIFWRFAQGLAIPGVIAVTMAYISEESPVGKTGSTMATYVTGTVVGGFAGRLVAGLAAAHWNWQGAFVILGVATLVGALACWRLLPASTKFVRQANSAASLRALGGHLKNRQLLATYAVGFNVLFTHVALFTYINFYLAEPPFSLTAAGLGSIFFVYLIGAVITPVAGRWIDRVGYRRTLVAAVAAAAVGMLLTLSMSLGVVILGLALCCSGIFVCQSAASSHVGKAAGGARSSAAGLYVSLYYAGGAVGSVAPGLLMPHGSWPARAMLIIGVQLATGVLAGVTWRD